MNVPIDSLRLHPDAARVPLADHTDLGHLRTSLREFGQQDPVDVTPDNVILDGRTRWTLLRELDAKTIQVRVVDVPESQQTNYIVDRALSRRHLTAAQKQALNGLLRQVVVEVVTKPETREEVRIGMSQTQRSEKLGVTRGTVTQWDQSEAGVRNRTPGPEEPTHQRYTDGRIRPLHIEQPVRAHPGEAKPTRPTRLGKAATTGANTHGGRTPQWRRFFTQWCRKALPEDRALLLEIDGELHRALRLIGAACEHEEVSDGRSVA